MGTDQATLRAVDTSAYRYYRTAFAGEAMPFAFVDLDHFDRNVDDIAARAGEKLIRVASKSVRCVALLRRVFERSAKYQGIMSYSPREVLYLCEQGFDDFLMGYPVWRAEDIAALCEPVRSGKLIRFMVDCPEHIEHLGGIGRAHDVVLSACIDLDMSSDYPGIHFGVRRSGVTRPEQALAIVRAAQALEHVRIDSLMGYEAQIAGVPDQAPGQAAKNAFVRFLKARSIKEISARRAAVVQAIIDSGNPLAVVNGGGTGSIESTIEEDCVTEVTVGSGFYSPTLFDGYGRFRHLPAAGYAIEITRRPTPSIYTCQFGGYTASGAVGRDKEPKPYLPEGARLLPLEGAGEVQTPVEYTGPESLTFGDPIFMRYSKAGEFCERFNELLAVSNGAIVDRLRTYRGDGYAFG